MSMTRNQLHALFFNVPGYGHVNPSLPLVEELTRRGHRISYFITPGFREQVETAGAAFQPYEEIVDDYFSGPGMDGSFPPQAMVALMETTETILPGLIENARKQKPDLILYDGMCPWGYFTARALNLPAVASMALLQFGNHPPSAFLDPNMRRLLALTLRGWRQILAAARVSRRLGKKYGVEPLGPTFLLNAVGDLSIAYTSAVFQPYADKVHPSIRFVGRTLPEDPEADPALFAAAGDRPVVYVSLGSIINDNRDFFRVCIDAFAERDIYALITTGLRFRALDFGSLPANVAVHPWLPQAAVLKRASLFLSHGGLNSIHDALFYGVPLLLFPQQDEQRINAARVASFGAGLVYPDKQLNSASLLEYVDRLLREPGLKAKAAWLGKTLRDAGGIPKAADYIEELFGNYRAEITSARTPARP